LKKYFDLYLLFKKTQQKMPAHNERFGASGGVSRPTLCVGQHSPLSSKPHQYPRLPPSRRALREMRGRHLSGIICKVNAEF